MGSPGSPGRWGVLGCGSWFGGGLDSSGVGSSAAGGSAGARAPFQAITDLLHAVKYVACFKQVKFK